MILNDFIIGTTTSRKELIRFLMENDFSFIQSKNQIIVKSHPVDLLTEYRLIFTVYKKQPIHVRFTYDNPDALAFENELNNIRIKLQYILDTPIQDNYEHMKKSLWMFWFDANKRHLLVLDTLNPKRISFTITQMNYVKIPKRTYKFGPKLPKITKKDKRRFKRSKGNPEGLMFQTFGVTRYNRFSIGKVVIQLTNEFMIIKEFNFIKKFKNKFYFKDIKYYRKFDNKIYIETHKTKIIMIDIFDIDGLCQKLDMFLGYDEKPFIIFLEKVRQIIMDFDPMGIIRGGLNERILSEDIHNISRQLYSLSDWTYNRIEEIIINYYAAFTEVNWISLVEAILDI